MNRTRALGTAVALGLVVLAAVWTMRPGIPALRVELPETVFLEDMTWTEVAEALRQGKTGVIVPTGGVEQNGPHMILGKHNRVVHHTAEAIARALGNTLVAPVVGYVPEGDIKPPSGHMLFAGTLSIPEPVFEALLESTARSLKAHGFTRIYFIGDSGGNQAGQARVAEKLTAEWAGQGVLIAQIGDYYAANGQIDWLLQQGETRDRIGSHAGIRDTSEVMAVYPDGIRRRLLHIDGQPPPPTLGVLGDPGRASAERGRALLNLKVQAALRQIRGLSAVR